MGRHSQEETNKTRVECKKKYMQYWQMREIAEFYDINLNTVKAWSSRGEWPKERKLRERDDLQGLAQRRFHQLNKVITDSLDALAVVASDAKINGVTVQEAKTLAEVLEKTHKLYQLAQGKPTEITEARQISTEHREREVLEIIKSDPFLIEGDSVDDDETKEDK